MLRRSFLFGAAFSAWAQEPTYSSDVNVVSLAATVRDADGRVARDLGKDDFVLEQDGKRQTIRYFSRESNLPLTIGLLVDTSRSQSGVLEREREASYSFLTQMLRGSADRAFVVSFDDRVRVLQGLTSSRRELAAALSELEIPGVFATLLYEAVKESAENVMGSVDGRKAFILLTDGFSFRDRTSLETAMEYAQRADVTVYAIRMSGGGSSIRPARAMVRGITAEKGKHALEKMAGETGGEMYEVSAGEPIGKVYAEIEEALRSQYSIGYTPEPKGEPGTYHRIRLRVKQGKFEVRTRAGYYAR